MYKITIEKIVTEKVTKQGEYGVIETRPYTVEEMKNVNNPEDYKGAIKDVRGYKPSYETLREVKTTILEQTVENIDLNTVLIAINNIKGA